MYDWLLHVAREGGLAYYGVDGQQRAMPPIDQHDLDWCKEIINHGISNFVSDCPATGWRWQKRILQLPLTGTRVTGTIDTVDTLDVIDASLITSYPDDDSLNGWYIYITSGTGIGSWAIITDYESSTGTISVAEWLTQSGNPGGTSPAADSGYAITPVETVGGNIGRYPLPEDCVGADGQIKYAADSNVSVDIQWVSESYIRGTRAITTDAGYPTKAAIRRLEPIAGTLGPKRRYELLVDPNPYSNWVLEFPYTAMFNALDCETGLADSAGSTTLVDSARTEVDGYFIDWIISIVNGTGKGLYAVVTDFASGAFTVTEWLGTSGSGTPDENSVYYVEPMNNLHPAGQRFDACVLAAILANAEDHFEDMQSQGNNTKYIQKFLPQAYKIDAMSAPRKLNTWNTRPHERTNIYRNANYVIFGE
jgi:hypothetical protein